MRVNSYLARMRSAARRETEKGFDVQTLVGLQSRSRVGAIHWQMQISTVVGRLK